MTHPFLSLSKGTFALPPGFRFHPTDKELISCYLNGKLSHGRKASSRARAYYLGGPFDSQVHVISQNNGKSSMFFM